MADCFFCAPDSQAVITETADGRVILPRGPLIPGHVLLAARTHEPCFAGASEPLLSALLQLRAMVAESLYEVSGLATVFYEHGAPDDHGHDVHCGHAHQNAVPATLEDEFLDGVVAAAASFGITFTELAELSLHTWYQGQARVEYYYVGSLDRHFVGIPDQPPGARPNRLLRRAFARVLGRDERHAVAWDAGSGRRAWEEPTGRRIGVALRHIAETEAGAR